ncbi:MAG TPA: SDR family NAD(P)-dependent oxidoreductase [Rhizomicrobium sp.]|nr:SDR family NAD(P)-dependent oxidoreductase [Rhizomicrobium sp.]
MKSVVVTGASTGIGWGCVKVLTAAGFRVFGSVRKQADADRLAREFGANFVPLIFDVTDQAAVAAGAEKVAAALGGETLAGLVNNAGIAVPGPLLYLGIDDFRHQIDVNLTGQLIVTQAFAPLLGADRSRKGAPGRIVMMSSIGGKNAFPFTGPYHASKFALEGLSESLRRELLVYGIDVILIRPGAVATPIWDKADAVDVTRFDNTPYMNSLAKIKDVMIGQGRKGYPPERIGRAVLKALTLARPKTAYTENPDPVQEFMVTHLPKRLVDRLVASQLGLKRVK